MKIRLGHFGDREKFHHFERQSAGYSLEPLGGRL